LPKIVSLTFLITGFVTFSDSSAAQRALAAEHTIDGRRCEAKVALPKVRVGGCCSGMQCSAGVGSIQHVFHVLHQGEPTPPRTTRIFVARIPPSVTEAQFRSYFEAFGKLQDAYMPKDHSKQVGGCSTLTITSQPMLRVTWVSHMVHPPALFVTAQMLTCRAIVALDS
jgi:RNA recognition motif-containing protein